MHEVAIRIRFIRESLGHIKRTTRSGNIIYGMPKDSEGRVMFLPTWWRSALMYAAQVLNRHSQSVDKIMWAPIVDGAPAPWRRYLQKSGKRRSRFALHEAFKPGQVIGVTAVIPDALSIDQFAELLNLAGMYRGISPFQKEDDRYGTFEVVSAKPARKHDQSAPDTQERDTD